MLLKLIMLAGILMFVFLSDAMSGSATLSANCKSGLLVVVGPLLGTLLAYQLPTIKSLFCSISKMLNHQESRDFTLINEMEKMAHAWQTSGHRGLETAARESNYPFLRAGAGLIADGYKASEIRKILASQCEMHFSGREAESSILLALAKLTQSFGFIGTVIGLIKVLGSMDDPVAIGNGMSIALLTTLHGLLLANFIYMPLYKKFQEHLRKEYKNYSLIIEGVTSLAIGKSSRSITYRLHSFLGDEHNMTPREKRIIAMPSQRLAVMEARAA